MTVTILNRSKTMHDQIDLRPHFLNKPLLMSQESAEAFAAMSPDSFFIDSPGDEAHEQMFDMMFLGMGGNSKPYRMVDGVAIIPIQGALLHRFSGAFRFATGYDYVGALFDMAVRDEDVKGIVLDVNSGGGMVDGAFELSDKIYSARGAKPIASIVDAHAYSAAYLVASAADTMTVPRTGGAGSIGVVTMHADMSKMLDNAGVKITFIHAGARKVDGNPYQALPADVRERIQTRIDASYDIFVNAVVRHRGLSAEDVKATEAGTFGGEEALDLGLVDAVASPEEAFAAFVAELNGETKETVMADSKHAATSAGQQAASAAGDQEQKVTMTHLETAVAEAHQKGRDEGAAAERGRFNAVISSEHFAGREDAATRMLATTLSADEINDVLAATPKGEQGQGASSASQGSHFDQAMQGTGNPDVGAGDQAGAEDEQDSVSMIVGDWKQTTGRK
jgi:signal peptide peptidase SppA